MRFTDLTGQHIGRLLFIRATKINGKTHWECRCDCGSNVVIPAASGKRSCGCWRRDINIARNTTHNMSFTGEYNSYNAMKQRCYYTKSKAYARYGGRGIAVCDRWLESFQNFYADMGPKPTPEHSIDRIDPHGNYEPGNCRWLPMSEQATNRAFNFRVTMESGDVVTLKEAARRCGANYGTVRSAVHDRGEDPLEACRRIGAGLRPSGKTA